MAVTFSVYAHPDTETYEYVGNYTKRAEAVTQAKAFATKAGYEGIAHVRREVTKPSGAKFTFEECTVDDEGEVC